MLFPTLPTTKGPHYIGLPTSIFGLNECSISAYSIDTYLFGDRELDISIYPRFALMKIPGNQPIFCRWPNQKLLYMELDINLNPIWNS